MSREVVGLVGILVLVLVMLTGMPIAFVFALIGFLGITYLITAEAAFSMLSLNFFNTFSSYTLSVIPLFVLMGYIAFNSGVSERLFSAGYKLFGRLRGGLYMGTIFASAMFGACCGSSPASAATMGAVAIPEMRRFKYSEALTGGCVAASGSLAILIPPSITFVVYGILTEQSIAKLFMAGVIPGIILAAMFITTIFILTHLDPKIGPPGPATTLKEKTSAILGMSEIAIIFLFLMGGLFIGFFTPTEGGALGAAMMVVIAVVRRNLTWHGFVESVKSSVSTGAMILLIIASATLFGNFLAVTRLPFQTADYVSALALSPAVVMMIIIFVYLILGCFMDTMAMILLTIPIFFPVSEKLGFDPIWFGVIIVVISEMGLITPPVGINVYVIKGIMKDTPLYTIFKGIWPFLICEIILAILLIMFPQIATWLPGFMTA